MFGRKAIAALACLAGAAAFASLGAGAQARGSGKTPKITARPDDVMVRGQIMLKGSGFPRRTVIQLRECGRTFWLAPEEPCNTGNAVSVKTNGSGRFKTSLMAEVCPEGEWTKVPTERTCYIGEPQASEDSFTLVGAVKVIVTYP